MTDDNALTPAAMSQRAWWDTGNWVRSRSGRVKSVTHAA